jgi:hypothetical protein
MFAQGAKPAFINVLLEATLPGSQRAQGMLPDS